MDDTQFRQALQLYESKNYKQSISTLDKVLKKNPLHSQSYALKALVFSFYNPDSPQSKELNTLHNVSEETMKTCEELIKKSLKYGGSNSVTAHLIALYYRQVKNYEKAAYYFTVTLSGNPSNHAVLRDLASCLSQLKTYKSLKQTRFDYLQAQPGYRQNYSSTAVAYDLNNEYESAIKICNQIETIIKDKLISEDMTENSECIIYKATLMVKKGDYQEALDYVTDQLNSEEEFKCYDITGLLELKYQMLMKLDRFDDAHFVIRTLLKRNPDNLIYYNDLIKCLRIENNDELKLKVFKKLAQFYPKSDLPRYIPLTFLKGDEFAQYLKEYLHTLFQRGVPSVFSNIKSLYSNNSNHEIILSTVKLFELEEKNPLILTWIKYFISQHYYKLKDYVSAMETINEAIEITPTLIELLMFKARILKHQGKLLEASKEMNSARQMDLQDRFVNAKTTKYYLRADLVDEALETVSLFTKNEDDAKTGIKDLHSVQCCWFIVEYAESLTRLFKKNLVKLAELESSSLQDEHEENVHLLKRQVEAYLGLSLQRYFSIFSIFAEYYDDQFDFHYYCFRKGTLRSYMEMVKWGDSLYHQAFVGRVYSDLMSLVLFMIQNREQLEKVFDLSTTLAKRSKKDKKEEMRWREHFLAYNKVTSNHELGENLVDLIFKKKDYSKLTLVEELVSKKNGDEEKPQSIEFLKGSFNHDFVFGKYVVSLASVRKVKAISSLEGEKGEKAKALLDDMLKDINEFIDSPVDDPKIQSLQKIVKLGLMRL